MTLVRLIIVGILLAAVIINIADAKEHYGPPTLPEYTVAIKSSPPFAYQEDGKWKGLSVDLVKMLSKEIKFNYTFKDALTIQNLLDTTSTNIVNFGIAAVSLTEAREEYIDFSHPYFSTTQGILVKESNGIFWFITKRVIAAFVGLIIMLYIIGFIVARLDPDDAINNAHKGAWFVLVTFTTTGYGDVVPEKPRAKVFAGFIMIASMFLLAAFTSYVTATLTIEKLSSTPITLAGLASKTSKVIAVESSSTSNLLNQLSIKHKTTTSADEAFDNVKMVKSTAFVYDKALLDYMVLNSDNTNLVVHPLDRGMERYGIVFAQGSKLREDFNVAILKIIASPEWEQFTAQYFGN